MPILFFTTLLGTSLTAWGEFGWNINPDGLPVLLSHQVYECNGNDGAYERSFSGKARIKGTCLGRLAVGTWKSYHPNERIKWKGAYVDGNKVGSWYSWTEQGQRKKEKHGGETTQGRCWWPLF